MTTRPHTPGPWTHERDVNENFLVTGDNGAQVCTVSNNPDKSDPECDANARLIAAAPTLLAALYSAQDQLEQFAASDKERRDPGVRQALREVREAIAKTAESETATPRASSAPEPETRGRRQMKTYSVLFAEDVPHYGCADIEAKNDTAALDAAKTYDLSQVTTDAEWENSVSKRIVCIEGPDGNAIFHDVPLDGYDLRSGGDKERRLCDAAAAMLEALELCEDVLSELARLDDGTPSISALNMARAAIAKANGGAL